MNNDIFKEYENLKNEYVEYFKIKDKSNVRFRKNHIVRNLLNNEMNVIKTDYKTYIKEYFNLIIQRLIYNKVISKEQGLIPFFITFTLPSEYHPFINFENGKKLKNRKINPNYKFSNLKEGIKEGYKHLYKIFRTFYDMLKKGKRSIRKYGKLVRYNYFIEYHKSFVPHIHIILYIPVELKKWLYQVYNKILTKFGMNPKSNKLIEIVEQEKEGKKLNNLDGSVLYISKYITKNLKSILEIDDLKDLENEKVKIKEQNLILYLGWKKYNNIRIFGGSRTKIGINNYKKIYYLLEQEQKEKLLEKVKKENTCLLYEIEKITTVKTKINNKVKVKPSKNSRYNVILNRERIDKFNYINYYLFLNKVKKHFEYFIFNVENLKLQIYLYKDKLYEIYKVINEYINIFDFTLKNKYRLYKDDDIDFLIQNKIEINNFLNEVNLKSLNLKKEKLEKLDIKKIYEYFILFIFNLDGDEIETLYKDYNLIFENEVYQDYFFKLKKEVKEFFNEKNEYFNFKKFNYTYYKLLGYRINQRKNWVELYNKFWFELEKINVS